MILDHFENDTFCAHEIAVLNAKYYTVHTVNYFGFKAALSRARVIILKMAETF